MVELVSLAWVFPIGSSSLSQINSHCILPYCGKDNLGNFNLHHKPLDQIWNRCTFPFRWVSNRVQCTPYLWSLATQPIAIHLAVYQIVSPLYNPSRSMCNWYRRQFHRSYMESVQFSHRMLLFHWFAWPLYRCSSALDSLDEQPMSEHNSVCHRRLSIDLCPTIWIIDQPCNWQHNERRWPHTWAWQLNHRNCGPILHWTMLYICSIWSVMIFDRDKSVLRPRHRQSGHCLTWIWDRINRFWLDELVSIGLHFRRACALTCLSYWYK